MPSGAPDANQLADQVYFVNHFYAFDKYAITMDGKRPKPDGITVIINKAKDSRPTTITVERYIKNDYSIDDKVKSKELAVFRSGKLRGTGMLITDFKDQSKSQSYAIWLPALRKIRRFAQPAHDDAWGGTDFTFGDVILRKPKDETHELLGTETFNDCLGGIADVNVKYLKTAPKPSCAHKGKEVYKLKSCAKRENWWYDCRVSYVDTKTFADYRTDYFKGETKIKVIDRDWNSVDENNPRALSWKYWYGTTLATGHETWAVIPKKVVQVNQDWKASKWTEKTLRRIKR